MESNRSQGRKTRTRETESLKPSHDKFSEFEYRNARWFCPHERRSVTEHCGTRCTWANQRDDVTAGKQFQLPPILSRCTWPVPAVELGLAAARLTIGTLHFAAQSLQALDYGLTNFASESLHEAGHHEVHPQECAS